MSRRPRETRAAHSANLPAIIMRLDRHDNSTFKVPSFYHYSIAHKFNRLAAFLTFCVSFYAALRITLPVCRIVPVL